ncbi:MAG: UDP-glucose 4-epimerase GalE [Alphaproteobacteria bacterium]|nr:MAG: UDP-glucose 4-epimerase GalE [Alphaproteobacteria bacterium]
MHSRNVLVTGGAGYIGSHACQALAAAGYTPVVYDNLSHGHADAVKFGPLVQADVRDDSALLAAFRQYKPVAVMHFAALIKVAESVTHPADYYNVNTHGAWQVLNTIRATGIVPFIFSSTAAVYGIPAASPISENTPLNPINPYGQSKLMVENMLADYAHAYNLPSVSLRYFNAAGASLDGSLGVRTKAPTHLIPSALDAVLGHRLQLEMFGTDYPTPDGTAVRDYIHVTDLATAHVAALEHLLKGGETLRLNLGTGQGYSVREIINAVAEVTGRPVPVKENPRRAGDPAELVADASSARKILNWQPQHSSLPTIIRTAWQWRQSLV